MTKEPRNPFIANEPEHLRALNSPVRNAILQLLISSGPSTIPSIAEQLGRKPKSLYRHVELLLKAGLLTRTGTQATRRRSAAEYGFPGATVRVQVDSDNPDQVKAVGRYFATELRHAHRELVAALGSGQARTWGPNRNLRMMHSVGWLDRKKLRRVLQLTREIETIFETSPRKAGTELLAVTVAIRPAKRSDVD